MLISCTRCKHWVVFRSFNGEIYLPSVKFVSGLFSSHCAQLTYPTKRVETFAERPHLEPRKPSIGNALMFSRDPEAFAMASKSRRSRPKKIDQTLPVFRQSAGRALTRDGKCLSGAVHMSRAKDLGVGWNFLEADFF